MYAVVSLLVACTTLKVTYSKCNSYYQSSSASSTKRPFDICYHSQVDVNGNEASYRYYCVDDEDYGINAVDGYAAFREDFNTTDCQGTPYQTRIVNTPYQILCAAEEERECEILRVRQYAIINATACTYNSSIYEEDIEVIALCDDNGDSSEAVFCNKKDENDGHGSYFWTNVYYDGSCDTERKFEASYQFHGCQGDGETFLEIVACDFDYEGLTVEVRPFDDGLFVTGFVLLLVAIVLIIAILCWYCAMYFGWCNGRFRRKGHDGAGIHVAAKSANYDEEDYEDGGGDQQTDTMR